MDKTSGAVSSIVDQIIAAADLSAITAVVGSIGVLAVGVAVGMKAISKVKSVVGKA